MKRSRSRRIWSVAGLLLICSLLLWYALAGAPGSVTVRAVVHFITPAYFQTQHGPENEEVTRVESSWRNPADWARLKLEAPEFPQWLNQRLRSRPNASEFALTMVERGALKTREISPGNLEVLVKTPQASDGRSVCEAVVAYLEACARQELDQIARGTDLQEHSIREDATLSSMEQRFQAEELDQRRTITDFALRRYAEKWKTTCEARKLRLSNRMRLQSTVPRLTILWGPALVQTPANRVADYTLLILGTLVALLVLSKVFRREV